MDFGSSHSVPMVGSGVAAESLGTACGTFAATGYGEAVIVDGNRAFLAAGYGGVVVLDLQGGE